MIKRYFRNIIPKSLLNAYKKRQIIKIIQNFDIKDEPDLIVAQKLVNSDSLFIDIGTNIGLYTKFLSPFASKTIAYEPVPFTFSMLSNVVSRFRLENVKLNQIAISDKNGESLIDIPIHTGVYNYYRASMTDTSVDLPSGNNQVLVKTKTIDSILLNYAEQISFIKCDVEGHELFCINGAHKLLNQARPSWLIEISGNPDDENSSSAQLLKIMRNYNYRIFLFENMVLRPRTKGDQSVNYFFLQESHIALLNQTNIVVQS
ncbi:MAG: FkbM family methyltransferase [Balneolales bacterium]